ncbi:MAG: AAA family ATPase [Proteobacteria bacterium]|nr:AAA family ATPase [Pseudomonadota bacterium]
MGPATIKISALSPVTCEAGSIVVGAVLAEPKRLAEVPDLEVDDFADLKHRAMWKAIRRVESSARPLSLFTVRAEIEACGEDESLAPVGPGFAKDRARAYIDGLARQVDDEDFGAALAHVRDTSARRKLAIVGETITSRARRSALDPGELLADSRRLLDQLEPATPANGNAYGTPISMFIGDQEPDEDDSNDWYLRGLVARDVVGFVGGDPKIGKTMIVESWAVALALGVPDWCGFPVAKRARVLLMPREDSERTTKMRLWRFARGLGLNRPHDLGDWLHVDPTSPLNLGDPAHIAKLRRACEGFDVVFIDSFTTSHQGDENSVRDIAHALDPVRDIAIGTKTSIVFVHHFNGKGNADDKRGVKHRLRGSSAISGYARHIVGVSRGPAKGDVELATDGNLEFHPDPFVVRLVGDDTAGRKAFRYEMVGLASEAAAQGLRDEVVAMVAGSPDGFASANAINKALPGNRQAVLAAVRHELQLGGRLEHRENRIHARAP